MYDVKQFKPTLYLLVLLGITGFCIAAQTPGLWVLSATLSGLNIAWVASGRFTPMPRWLANVLVVLAALYVGLRITGEGTPVLIVGQFLVALQLIKLYEQRANRDLGQLIVLSLLLMVAAAISTTSLFFGVLLVAYLFLSLYCCLLFHLKVETDAARRSMGLREDNPGNRRKLRQDQRRLGSSMRRLTGLVSVVSVLFAVMVFLVFPRGSGAQLVGRDRTQFRSTEAVTGFSGKVSFQDLARITQNETPVAYLELLRNGLTVRGAETLYLRGNTLDLYVSEPDATDRWTWRKTSLETRTIGSADQFGSIARLGPAIASSPIVYEQRFELQAVGLDVLPTLAGTFLVTVATPGMRYNRGDGTLSTSIAQRRELQFTAWSTGAIPEPLSSAGLPSHSEQVLHEELMRMKALYDRAEVMRLATLGELSLRGSGEQRAGAQMSRFGLPAPGGMVIDQEFASNTLNAHMEYYSQIAAYPAPPEIIRFATDPAVSGTDSSGESLARQRLRRSGATELDEQIARNISNYLQTQYRYTLDVTDARLSSDQDPLAWFVGEEGRRGHCEFFAGTAALACQALGIPARVVVGFKTNEFNTQLNKYVVRQSHAHAWIEVLTQRGWVRFDPTAGNGEDLTRDRRNFLDTIQHWFEFVEYTWANSVVAYDNNARAQLIQNLERDVIGDEESPGLWDRFTAWMDRQNLHIFSASLVAWLIVAMVLSAVAILLWYALEQWRLRRRAQRIGLRGLPSDEARRLARQLAFYDDLVQLLERHGHRRQRVQTPREFAQSLAFLPRQAFDAVIGLTEVFYRVRYGNATVTPRRRRHLARSLDQLSAALR